MKALRGRSRGASMFGNQLTGPQAQGRRTPTQQGYNTTSVGPAHAQFEQQPTMLESLLTAKGAYTGAKEVNRIGSDLYHAGEINKPFGPGGAYGAPPGSAAYNEMARTGAWQGPGIEGFPKWAGGNPVEYSYPRTNSSGLLSQEGVRSNQPGSGFLTPQEGQNLTNMGTGIPGTPLGLQGQSQIDKVNVMRNAGSGSGAAGGGLGAPANSGGLLDSLSSGVSNLGSDIGSFFGGADDAGAVMGDMANMPTEGGEALTGLQGTGAADAAGGLSGLGYALTGAGGAFGLYQGIDEGSALKMGGNAASLAMLQNPATALWAWIPQIVNFL